MWFLVAVVWVVMVAGIFWAYNRKRRRAISERTKDLSALIAEVQLGARSAVGTPAVAATAAAASPVAVTIDTYLRKPRVLGQTDALLYLLFRTGLPDHEIFANLTLADVVEPPSAMRAYEREQSARKLAQLRLNLVICNKQFEVIAVVLPAANASGAAAGSYMQSCLNAAGIRLLRIDAAALPRHQQVRALVYGENAPGAG